LLETHYESSIFIHRRSQGERAAGLKAPKPPKREFKKAGFLDIMISNLFRDFRFSRNQPLKSADDQYIRILKNKSKFMKFKKPEDRTL
jgi:hypothetical protein